MLALRTVTYCTENEETPSFDGLSGADYLELRANRFASCFLMPPAFLKKLPPPNQWSNTDAQRWANDLRVSCVALAIALKEAKLIDQASYDRIRRLRVPREAKIDPELPDSLNATQRQRKAHLLSNKKALLAMPSDWTQL